MARRAGTALNDYAALGHDEQGRGTYGPLPRTYALPNLSHVNTAGDFEAVLTFGVSLARAASFQMSNPDQPQRSRRVEGPPSQATVALVQGRRPGLDSGARAGKDASGEHR